RWRQPEIEKLLATPKDRRPNLTSSLASADPVVATNAAIVAFHWKKGEATQQLKSAAQNVDLTLPLRLAAVETLGNISSPSAHEAIDELLNEFGQFSTAEQKKTYQSDMHAELLCARSKHAEVA